jgi:hypothetical protein
MYRDQPDQKSSVKMPKLAIEGSLRPVLRHDPGGK